MSKIIKCMFFVLLAAVLPLSVHAQQVTLHLQDVTVRKAFRELEVKGNVSLVYEKNDVDLTRKVTVKVDAFDRGSYVKVIPEENKIVGYTTRNSGGVPQNFKNYFQITYNFYVELKNF